MRSLMVCGRGHIIKGRNAFDWGRKHRLLFDALVEIHGSLSPTRVPITEFLYRRTWRTIPMRQVGHSSTTRRPFLQDKTAIPPRQDLIAESIGLVGQHLPRSLLSYATIRRRLKGILKYYSLSKSILHRWSYSRLLGRDLKMSGAGWYKSREVQEGDPLLSLATCTWPSSNKEWWKTHISPNSRSKVIRN